MEKYFKEINWIEIFPETLKRLEYFRDAFRNHYTEEEISNDELDKEVVYVFAIYGQGEVYNIYSVAQQLLNENETLTESFKSFIKAFEEAIPETAKKLKPSNYISLFIEYIFSKFIEKEY